MRKTQVMNLTTREVARLVELVDDLRRTGYVHASEIDSRLGRLAEIAGRAGVAVLQIVRRRSYEGAALVLAPGLYASRDGRVVRDRENAASDLEIGRFGWGRPVDVQTAVSDDYDREGASGAGGAFFESEWEDADGQRLPSGGPEAVRGAVGPWYPFWFAENVPELLRLGYPQGRVVKRLADDEDFRKVLDSARRLGGSDAVLAVLVEASHEQS